MDSITSILLMEYETCVTRWEVATLAGVARDRGGIAHNFVMATRRYAQYDTRSYAAVCKGYTSHQYTLPNLHFGAPTCLACLAAESET